MKTTLVLCALAANALAAPPILNRVTPETLAGLQARDPMVRLVKPVEGEAKIARPQDQSIIKQSTILHDGGNWTLVPNGAVVFLPETMKHRVKPSPAGNLLSWVDFLTANRSWITTVEVSFDQAAGHKPIPPERAAFWAKQDKIVIAVHQRGPISVRLPETPPDLTKK